MDEPESKGETNRQSQSPSHFKQQFEEQRARTQAQNLEKEKQKDRFRNQRVSKEDQGTEQTAEKGLNNLITKKPRRVAPRAPLPEIVDKGKYNLTQPYRPYDAGFKSPKKPRNQQKQTKS